MAVRFAPLDLQRPAWEIHAAVAVDAALQHAAHYQRARTCGQISTMVVWSRGKQCWIGGPETKFLAPHKKRFRQHLGLGQAVCASKQALWRTYLRFKPHQLLTCLS